MEYGIFNDEGCLESDFYSREAAEHALLKYAPDDPHAYVEEVCEEHRDQPRFGCEECNAEEEEPEEDMTENNVSEGKDSGFSCMECGHKFKTIKAAERAAFGPNGCPKCGGSDIDLTGTEDYMAPEVQAKRIESQLDAYDTARAAVHRSKTAQHPVGLSTLRTRTKNEATHPAWPSMIEPDARLESNVSMDDIRTIVKAIKGGASKERLARSPASKRLGITVKDIDDFMTMDERGLLERTALRESKENQSTDEFDKFMDDILTREALARKHQQEQQNAPESANRMRNKRYGELPQNSIRYGVKK